jgi:hypothetical protein
MIGNEPPQWCADANTRSASWCAVPLLTDTIDHLSTWTSSLLVGRPMPPLDFCEDDDRELPSIANSRSIPHLIVQRARIIMACGAGATNSAIATRMGVTGMTVGKCLKRYREDGIEGLHSELLISSSHLRR